MGQTVSTVGSTPYRVTIPNQGELTGATLKNPVTGVRSVHRFTKVPYAKPTKRFCLPEMVAENYDYTDEYIETGKKCPQPVFHSDYFSYPKGPIDENIQYLNIHIPESDENKPEGGWPVLIYIHGGWLQYGEPNFEYYNQMELFAEDEDLTQKFICVYPGYRLNIFGFLSCKELMEENPDQLNLGFWDQRLAIEWTYKYIKYFGGNHDKITLGGLSAGSYSTFFQLAYELYHPEEKQIIKQVCFFSNMILAQPKTVDEYQNQFDEICQTLDIASLSSKEKIQKLRDLSIEEISYDLIPKLKWHTFRAVTDNNFVSNTLLSDIDSGVFGKMLSKKGVRIFHGETDNEGFLYSWLDRPHSKEQLAVEIENYYPKSVVPVILDLYEVDKFNPPEEEFQEKLRILYGDIIGDGQIFCSTRGFAKRVTDAGFPCKDYFRYRVSFRGEWMEKYLAPEHKIPHAYDSPVWFYSLRLGFIEWERERLVEWLTPYLKFLNFEADIPEWPTEDIKKLRYFGADGSIEYIEDPSWDWGVKVADAVYDVQLNKK